MINFRKNAAEFKMQLRRWLVRLDKPSRKTIELDSSLWSNANWKNWTELRSYVSKYNGYNILRWFIEIVKLIWVFIKMLYHSIVLGTYAYVNTAKGSKYGTRSTLESPLFNPTPPYSSDPNSPYYQSCQVSILSLRLSYSLFYFLFIVYHRSDSFIIVTAYRVVLSDYIWFKWKNIKIILNYYGGLTVTKATIGIARLFRFQRSDIGT